MNWLARSTHRKRTAPQRRPQEAVTPSNEPTLGDGSRITGASIVNDNWDFDEDDDWGLVEGSGEHGYAGLDLSEEINVGHRLRDLRSLAEVSADSLANHAKISNTDLLAIEAGILQLDRGLAATLAEGLGVHLLDIWIDDDWPEDEAA